MLLKYHGRLNRRFSQHTLCCLHYSTESPYANFIKLRAFPFSMTPEMAQKHMARVAGPLCDNLGLFPSIWAVISPSRNFLRPMRFSAAYFPAWVVNAEIEADIMYGETRRRGTLIFRDSYIPGSYMPTLSAAPLWGDELEREESLSCFINHGQNESSDNAPGFFDPSLLKQHGQEVQCIPFTTSPFVVLDIARNLSWADAVIDENIKFYPSSMKVNLCSAYPVLLPLYIAMYEIKYENKPSETLTMWIQAHIDWPKVMMENSLGKFDKAKARAIATIFGAISNPSPNCEAFSYLPPDDQVKISMMSFPVSKKASNTIERWLQKALGSSINIARLASAIKDDSDPRIRPMVEDEKVALTRYFTNEGELLIVQRLTEALRSAGPDSKVITIGLGGQQGISTGDVAAASIQTRLNCLLKKKEELKPQWWTEWEQSQDSAP